MVSDCIIRYEQELAEWDRAVEGVVQDCDQKLKLVQLRSIVKNKK